MKENVHKNSKFHTALYGTPLILSPNQASILLLNISCVPGAPGLPSIYAIVSFSLPETRVKMVQNTAKGAGFSTFH